MMRDKIITELRKIVPKNIAINVTASQDGKFGHYSTNVAFEVSKREGKQPRVVAENVAQKLAASKIFKKVEAVNGFVNFWLTSEVLQKELQIILKNKSSYGRGGRKREKIQVEFISANPTGPLTLANGRGGFLGDVLSNVLEWNGFKVEREYYINDTGNQVITLGKSAAAVLDFIRQEDNFYKGSYVGDWARKNALFVRKNKENYLKIGQKAATQFLKKIKTILIKKAGIKFDRWTSEEKDIHKKGFVKKTLEIFKKKGLTYKKDGALWLKTTELGDDKDRVLITSDGFPTYFLSDAGHYLETKIRGFRRKINILGPDHHGYVGRIQAAAEIVGLQNSEVIVTQVVRLMRAGEEVKMSKRKGEFITFDDLIDEVGADAARFFFLMVSPDTHMDFNLELAKERSVKNPVYYVQYAHVRAASIMNKAKKIGGKPRVRLLNTEDDLNLMRKISEFPEVIEDTASDLQAHRLSRYATDLARAFHNFYEKEQVIGKDANLASARLALVRASAVVLKNLLDILGISAPKKM